jgi:hypothetical protein
MNNYGGRRKGAGRKRVPETLTYSMRLTPAQVKLLKEWGNGNCSAGLRWLIEMVAPMIRKCPPDDPRNSG